MIPGLKTGKRKFSSVFGFYADMIEYCRHLRLIHAQNGKVLFWFIMLRPLQIIMRKMENSIPVYPGQGLDSYRFCICL